MAVIGMRRHWAGGGRLLCAEQCEGRRCQETLAGGAGAPTLQEEPSGGEGVTARSPGPCMGCGLSLTVVQRWHRSAWPDAT